MSFVVAMMLTQLACAVEATSTLPQDGAAVLEVALRAEYPQVMRWQLSRVSIAQNKRRPKLFAKVDGQVEVRRDGNLFSVQFAPSAPRLGYRVAGYQPVNVVTAYLPAHQALQAASRITTERDLLSLGCAPLLSDVEVSAWRMRRSIKPGAVLCIQDVEVQPMIARNDAVTIRCDRGDVSVAASGVALSDGALGQIIQVRRQGRYRAMHATVADEGEVNACI